MILILEFIFLVGKRYKALVEGHDRMWFARQKGFPRPGIEVLRLPFEAILRFDDVGPHE